MIKKSHQYEKLYTDNLDTYIERIKSLQAKKRISSQLAQALIKFYVWRETKSFISDSLEHVLRNKNRKEKVLYFNYHRSKTSYAS